MQDNEIVYIHPSSLLPDLKEKGVELGVRQPAFVICAAAVCVLLFFLAFPGIATEIGASLMLTPSAPVLLAGLLIVILQFEFTYAWTQALAQLNEAVSLSKKSMLGGPKAFPVFAGILTSPIIPLVLLLLLSFVGTTFIGSDMNAILFRQPIVILLLLLLSGNGISALAAWSNYKVIARLTLWISEQDKDAEPEPIPMLVPLALVLPTWFALWTFPHPISALYLVATPFCIMYSFNKLSYLNEKIRKILDSQGPVERAKKTR